MRRIPAILLHCFLSVGTVSAQSLSGLANQWERARALYDAREFRNAAAVYEQILIDRGPSPQVYYNLGNTYFRMEEFGRAALCYERALLMEPNHVEARANLSHLRAKMGSITQEPNLSARILNAIPHNIAVLAATALAWLAVFALIVAIFLRGNRLPFVVCAVFLALAAGTFPILRATSRGLVFDPSRAVVIHQNSAARYSPALGSPTAQPLPPGSVVKVLLQRGAWSYVATSNNQRGWIQTASIESPLPPGKGKES